MVRPSELESPTSAMSRQRSNQLSYGRIVDKTLPVQFQTVFDVGKWRVVYAIEGGLSSKKLLIIVIKGSIAGNLD